MRKTFLCPVVVSSVLLVGVGMTLALRLVYRSTWTANRQTTPNPISVSVFTVLQAHSGHQDKEWPRFTQKGTLRYYPAISVGSQRAFERELRLSIDRSIVRYDKATLSRNQSFLFNGHTLVRTTFDGDTQLETKVIDGVEAASIKFQIATFGLLPILRRLSEPSTQVVYVGATSKGNRFQVKTVGGSWYFYANSNHLIDRLEVNDINITYGDYRTVEGLTLPFYQQVKKGDKLLYDIKLETFDLNPVFAVGFSRAISCKVRGFDKAPDLNNDRELIRAVQKTDRNKPRICVLWVQQSRVVEKPIGIAWSRRFINRRNARGSRVADSHYSLYLLGRILHALLRTECATLLE
jgi:hypothetical protein